MDFEAYMGSNYHLPLPVAGETMHPISSDIMFENGKLSRSVIASHIDSSYGTVSHHTTAASLSPLLVYNEMNPGVLVNKPYFEASLEKNALITGVYPATPVQNGSCLSNGSLNLPSSSMVTNTLCVTNSLCLDHGLVSQQLSQAVQYQSDGHKRQHKQLSHFSVSSPLSQSLLQASQVANPLPKFDESTQVQKKPRLESKKDDLFLRLMVQQYLLSESTKQFTSHDLNVPSLRQYQVQMLNALQRESISSLSKPIEAYRQQLVTQYPMINHQKQVPEGQVSEIPLIDGGTCAARLMEYLQCERNRPKQNNIAYWRKIISEYFASDAKKRCCFSKYDHVGHGAFSSQAVLDSWNCDLCGAKSGRGFEVTFEVLPRLCKVNFEGGVIDKLLYLDFPYESKLPMGCIMLLYTKAVQETVYKCSRVVHEGQLRVIFTKELKIMSWEFCTKHHEEFVPRRLIAPQVNQLIQSAQKYQDNIEKNRSDGGLRHSLQATHNRFAKAGDQLAKILDSPIASDFGLSKQHVRFFQIGEVVNCMKDLMAYSHENNIGPIESLNRFAQETKFKQTQMDERVLHQDTQALFSTRSKLMQMSSVSAQSPFDRSTVLNSGPGAEEAWNSAKPSSSTGYPSTISFTQGAQDLRKYVLNTPVMEKVLSSRAPQFSITGGVKGRNDELISKGSSGSPRKNASKRPAVGGPTNSSTQAAQRSTSMFNTGSSTLQFKGPIKTEMDMPEEHDLPTIPGVKVKKEVFYGSY